MGLAHVGDAIWRILERTPPLVSVLLPPWETHHTPTKTTRIHPWYVAPTASSRSRELCGLSQTVRETQLLSRHHEKRLILSSCGSTIGGISLSLAYGIRVLPSEDPYVRLAEEALGAISQVTVSGRVLVDLIPSLKHIPEWMPGAGFKRQAKIWYALQKQFRERPFYDCLKEIVILDLAFHYVGRS
jgi:hypothetical protein